MRNRSAHLGFPVNGSENKRSILRRVAQSPSHALLAKKDWSNSSKRAARTPHKSAISSRVKNCQRMISRPHCTRSSYRVSRSGGFDGTNSQRIVSGVLSQIHSGGPPWIKGIHAFLSEIARSIATE